MWNLQKYLRGVIYSHEETPLPWCIFSILYILLLLNIMLITVVYSYLPKLVKSFGASEEDAGYSAGYIASSLFLSRIFSNIIWGYLCDIKGRKNPLIISLVFLSIATLIYGFSDSFFWAITSRYMQGFFMALNVICPAKLAEICDETNYSLGYSILISTSSIARIIGPSLGGYLAFPADQYPSLFSKSSIFNRFPILLATLPLVIGLVITMFFAAIFIPADSPKKKKYEKVKEENDTIDIKEASFDETNQGFFYKNYNRFKSSTLFEVMCRRDCVIACMFNGLFSYVNVGSNETIPLFLATAKEQTGLGYSTAEIGSVLLVANLFLLVFQLTLQSRIFNYFGLKRCLVFSNLILAFIFPLLPTTAHVTNEYLLFSTLVLWTFVVRAIIALNKLAVNIILKTSVPLRLLGSATGLGMAANSIGSVLSPVTYGSAFAWSLNNVKRNNLGFPFDQYFVYLMESFWCTLTAILGLFFIK